MLAPGSPRYRPFLEHGNSNPPRNFQTLCYRQEHRPRTAELHIVRERAAPELGRTASPLPPLVDAPFARRFVRKVSGCCSAFKAWTKDSAIQRLSCAEARRCFSATLTVRGTTALRPAALAPHGKQPRCTSRQAAATQTAKFTQVGKIFLFSFPKMDSSGRVELFEIPTLPRVPKMDNIADC